jgi:hypothetical protein
MPALPAGLMSQDDPRSAEMGLIDFDKKFGLPDANRRLQ